MFGHEKGGLLHKQLQAIYDYASDRPNDLETAHNNPKACEKFAFNGLKILESLEDNFNKIMKELEKEIKKGV